MVKGISRQVIVVHAPEPKLFEQAIFILKEGTCGVSDDALLKEAQQAIRENGAIGRRKALLSAFLWAACGAAVMGLLWLGSILIG